MREYNHWWVKTYKGIAEEKNGVSSTKRGTENVHSVHFHNDKDIG